MFTTLKQQIREQVEHEETDNLIIDSVVLGDVKDLFINTENIDDEDPELEKILDEIPEDECCNDDVDKVIEAYLGGEW